MPNYQYSAYGPNPNAGRNANAENGWGPYKWPGGVPANLMSVAQYGGVKLQVRKELVELVTLLMRVCEEKNGYNLYGPAEKPPAGWCWGYSNRAIAGTSTASNHSKGRAVDLNAPTNPYTSPLVCDMPPAMVNTWERAGFYWGGRYSGSKDAMHYEYCWTPNDVPRHVAYVRSVLGGAPTPTPTPPTPEDDLPYSPEQLRVINEQAVRNVLKDRAIGIVSGGTGASGSVVDFLGWTNGDAYNGMKAAQAVQGKTDVIIYHDMGGLWVNFINSGESSHLPDMKTMDAMVGVLQSCGYNVKIWEGGDVTEPGAFGRRDPDALIPGAEAPPQ